MAYKLGSLFDGSGGFPLAGSLCGIEPVWAAEIEPYPIAVTRSRFPSMKHLGSVTDIHGGEIEPVDIITFGSPCQDLSVAGKRAGLKHEANGDEETTRSGLFMEAVRIIKEMRKATNGEYPSFALWENVPGAFSSQKGEDFRVVLEELIRIVEPNASVPPVPKAGWAYADSYRGDGWSLAYRVFDAQYWGVPQRRRRIHLVLDLRGERAREVLFEREGVRGYFAQGRTPWQGTAADSQGGSASDDREGAVPYTLKIRSGCEGGDKGALIQTDKSATLATNNDQYLFQPTIVHSGGFKANQGAKAGGIGWQDERACTLNADRPGLEPTVCIKTYDARGNGDGEVVSTITGDHENRITDYTSVVCEPVAYNGENITSPLNKANPQPGDPCHTLGTDSRNYLVEPVYCLQGNGIDRADTAGCNGKGWREGASYTLNTLDRPAVAFAQQAIAVYKQSDVASNQVARQYKSETDLVIEQPIAFDRAAFNQGQNALYSPQFYEDGTNPTLVAKGPSGVAYGVDARNATEYPELNGTLQAKANGGFSYNCNQVVRVQYIVRRLTPTECARLQGFADRWGDIDKKDDFTEEEYRFWLDVRNLHAAINGRVTKEYTKAQMLKWYNGLHTDSAEYKLWGNGIALPPALYCMQGMTDVLDRREAEAWMH